MDPAGFIILFDGQCALCNSAVRFVLRRDRRAHFKFAPLQSRAAAGLLAEAGGGQVSLDSIVLLEQGRMYLRSTAALRIARRLDGLWPLLYGLIIIPPFLRDTLYDWIARHRYRWFGRREECMVPEAGIKQRFIE